MNGDHPADVAAAFEAHSSLSTRGGSGTVTTTVFDSSVTATHSDGSTVYTVSVELPTIDSVTREDVGTAVAADWLRTLRRRLEDAPRATRAAVDLDSFAVDAGDGTVRVEYVFSTESPAAAADIATAFVEFVEGTYVEGVVPGYEYEPPVADLLAQASQGEKGGTPL